MTGQHLGRIAFAMAIVCAALTFVIAVALTLYGSGMPYFLKVVYNMVIIVCVAFYVRNFFLPIFPESLMRRRPGLRSGAIFSLVYFMLFQAAVLYGFLHMDDYVNTYTSYMVILQIVNLLMLWVIICASFGQNTFRPFCVKIMTNPPGALGYALGFKLVRNTKAAAANDRPRKK